MKKYYTADREAGNFIDSFDTYQEAAEAIRAYEEEDRADGTYTEDFYEIKERSMDYKWFIIDDCGDIFETPMTATTREEAKKEARQEWERLTAADKSRRNSFEAVRAYESEIDPRVPDYETITESIKIY